MYHSVPLCRVFSKLFLVFFSRGDFTKKGTQPYTTLHGSTKQADINQSNNYERINFNGKYTNPNGWKCSHRGASTESVYLITNFRFNGCVMDNKTCHFYELYEAHGKTRTPYRARDT